MPTIFLADELDRELECALPDHFKGKKSAMRVAEVCRQWLESQRSTSSPPPAPDGAPGSGIQRAAGGEGES